MIEKENVTDPNTIAVIMSLEGYRPNRLLKIEFDNSAATRQAVNDAAALQFFSNMSNQWQQQAAYERQQMRDWQLDRIEHKLDWMSLPK